MTKQKINFEIDERVLAHAQAFAVQSRTSLSKLVSAFFAGLGQDRPAGAALSAMDGLLAEVSVGKVSVTDAARELGLQDAGFLLRILRERGLPLPALHPAMAKEQAQQSFEALAACLLPEPEAPVKRRASRGKRSAVA